VFARGRAQIKSASHQNGIHEAFPGISLNPDSGRAPGQEVLRGISGFEERTKRHLGRPAVSEGGAFVLGTMAEGESRQGGEAFHRSQMIQAYLLVIQDGSRKPKFLTLRTSAG
jgi:hypothetical protein